MYDQRLTYRFRSTLEGQNMNVLVVDDSMAMRMIVIKTAKKAGLAGHTFLQAADGALGLESIRAQKPDLVLSDWNMPNMTGIEMLEALNAEEIDVKFGFVTTEATTEMRNRARKAGALFLLAKPFTVETFEQALWVVLD